MSIALLFPGQGSQSPGMLHALMPHPAIVDTLDQASATLGRNVQELDTEMSLASTVSVQLALLVAGVATARALHAEGLIPEAVAGLSVGAFAAAVQCGVIAFEDAIRLVKFRAESMQDLFPHGYGLSAVVGLSEQQVSHLVDENHTVANPVYLANINARSQMVIAGSDAGMDKVCTAALQHGARKAQRLAVSVPSHCPLLEPIAAGLRARMKDIHLQIPHTLYISNTGARTLRVAATIAEDLANNIAHTVHWSDSTRVLQELGCDVCLEMPPGHVLRDLARQDQPSPGVISMETIEITPGFLASIKQKALARNI